jgi:hypothetical protein
LPPQCHAHQHTDKYGNTHSHGYASAHQYFYPHSYSYHRPAPDFTVSVSPASQTVGQDGSTGYLVTIGSVNDSRVVWTLSVTHSKWYFGAFNPNPVVGGAGNSVLTMTTSSISQPGTYILTIITGTSGALLHRQNVTLIITL